MIFDLVAFYTNNIDDRLSVSELCLHCYSADA